MRTAALAIVLFVSMFAASDALAGCYDCAQDEEGYGYCMYQESVNAGLWADCTGGRTCYTMPGGGQNCMPYCGSSRCYLI